MVNIREEEGQGKQGSHKPGTTSNVYSKSGIIEWSDDDSQLCANILVPFPRERGAASTGRRHWAGQTITRTLDSSRVTIFAL